MAFFHFSIVISTIPTAIISDKICDLPDLRQVQRVCAILILDSCRRSSLGKLLFSFSLSFSPLALVSKQ